MHRSLFPLILASLGILLILVVVTMPLFEWQISEIVTDFPSNYDVEIPRPSPWTAYLGDFLDDGSYFLSGKVRIIVDGSWSFCREENLKLIVKRSQSDKLVEWVLNANQRNTFWLFAWGVMELILSTIYIWWFIIEYKRGSTSQAVISMGIAGAVLIFLMLFSTLIGPQIPYAGKADCYGKITFNARLLKVHYATLIVLLIAILAELGALGVMVRQIVMAARERKSRELTEVS